jgi:hypothetical protein
VTAALLVAAATLLLPAAPAGARERDSGTTDPVALRSRAIAAYNELNYEAAAKQAAAYLEQARKENRTGREVASVAFILGHARYELHRQSGRPYEGDYALEVVAPLEESLRILQDDPAFKHMLLGNAWYTPWGGRAHRRRAEARGHRHLLNRSCCARRMCARSESALGLFVRAPPLFYLERCPTGAFSDSADLYIQRCAGGAGRGTAYDALRQIYDLAYLTIVT